MMEESVSVTENIKAIPLKSAFTTDSYTELEYVSVTVENVLDVTPLQLAKWIVIDVLSLRLPAPSLNVTVHIESDLVPLLPVLANRIATVTELYVVVVGATPTQTTIRTSGGQDSKLVYESLSRKKDELYRTLQTLESMREAVSRMMTGISSADKLSGRFSGM